MSIHRHPFARTSLALAAMLVLSAVPAGPAMAGALCTWQPASGNWADGGSWSCGTVPTGPNQDSATIAGGKTVTVNTAQSIYTLANAGTINIDAFNLTLQSGGSTTNSGTINIGTAAVTGSLLANNDIANAGGNLNIRNGSVLDQFASNISGGTITTTGTGALVAFSNSNNFLSGVTVNGLVDVTTTANARERIVNGLTLNGTMNIGNGGIVSLDSTNVANQAIAGTGTINLQDAGARLALEGTGTTTLGAGITVQGQGNVGLALFSAGNNTLVNNGKILANVNGGTLTLTPPASSGSVTNNGTLAASNGGTLALQSAIANAGTVSAAAGSVVEQDGIRVTGGAISSTGTGAFRANSSGNNYLDGTAVSGTLDLSTIANARERIVNGLTLAGNVNIGNGGILSLDSTTSAGAAQTISGTGSINLNDAGAYLSIEGTGNTTLAAGITVHGQGNVGLASYSAGNNTLTNNGLISADVAAGTLTLTPPGSGGSIVNNATLRAINGGTLALQSAIANNGTISAAAGSVVEQDAVRVAGGSITTAGTGAFRANSSSNNFLDGTSVSGTLDLSTIANARERIVNGLTLAGNVNVANGGILSLDSSTTTGNAQTISGTASINLNDGGALLSIEGTGSTTLGAGITVHGQGSIGLANYSSGNNVLTSNGTISADVNGGTLTLNNPASSGSFVNNGTLQAINGGTLVLATNITANPGSQIVSGTGSAVVQSGVTINGTFASSGGGLFTATSSGNNILNNVSFTGNLDASSIQNARERIGNNLALNGSVTIGNGGIVSLDSTLGASNAISGNATFNLNDSTAWLAIDGTGTTTLGAGVTVRGQGNFGQAQFSGGNNALTNNGLVSADVAGGTLTVNAPANGGPFTNNGKLQAVNGGILTLTTSILANSGSQILAGNGSQVIQSGVTLNGAINTQGTGVLSATSNGNNYLNAAAFTGTLDATSIANARERIVNDLVLNGTVNIANGGIVSLDSGATTTGVQSVTGTGSINLNDAGAWLSIEGTGSTTLGSGIVVHGQGNVGQASYNGGSNTLTNNGRITADVAGGTLTINTPGNGGILNNAGLVDARNGGTLMLSSNVLNTGGTINAQTGSKVVQNGVIITDGTISTAGTGSIVVASSGSNYLTNVTIAGVVDMASIANARERIYGGATVNGTINVANGGILSLDSSTTPNQTIAGTGSIALNDAGARLTFEGTGVTTLGAGLTVHGQGNIGVPNFSGGNNTLVNNGTISADVAGATLTLNAPANGGTVTGTGTLQANGGTLAIATGSDVRQGKLVVGATGSAVTLDGHNVIISSDYTNAQSGSGNTYDRHAGITGTGSILASGSSAQVITGTGISGGSTANATLTLGNVRVGTTTYNYTVTNADATGPTLRGAVQTSVNGANLTDARLGGSGASAGTYSSTGSQAVTFTVSSAGALAPLTGQSVNLHSNFDNIADQKLNIVLGSTAAAYQAAAGQLQTTALNFGTVQVGQAVSQNLVVRNTAAGASGYVEDLNASFGAASGTGSSLISGSGSLNGIVAGSNSTAANGTMTVTVNTQAAGVVNGGIAVNYATAGAVNGVSNGLGTASVGSQNFGVAGTIQATATVINQASPQINNPSINLGAARVGDTAPSAKVSVTNVATASPQAALNASIGGATGPVTASGAFNQLAPGMTNGVQLGVGLSTATAGNFTGANAGSATVSFVSDASNVGGCGSNCQLALASQQVTVSGKVYSAATVQANTTAVSFGVVHVGDAVTPRGVSVTNSGAATALSDTLTGSIGSATGAFNASGSFSSLAAQGTNAGSLTVGLNTATSGAFSGTATATFASHDADLADLALGTKTIALTGTVDNYAAVAIEKTAGSIGLSQTGSVYTLNFGNVMQGSTDLSDTLAVFNSASGLADLLGGSFTLGNSTGFLLNGFGPFSGLGAGQSFNGLMVSLDSSNVGSFSDTITLHSSGSNGSGYNGALGDVTLQLQGSVSSAAAVPEPGIGLMLLAGIGALFGSRRLRARRATASKEI